MPQPIGGHFFMYGVRGNLFFRAATLNLLLVFVFRTNRRTDTVGENNDGA